MLHVEMLQPGGGDGLGFVPAVADAAAGRAAHAAGGVEQDGHALELAGEAHQFAVVASFFEQFGLTPALGLG